MPANTARWNAAEYAANSFVQQAWARELIAKLKLHGDEHILDVGCGDGKVTAEIARAVPHGSATGVDASRQMIAFAKKAFPANKHPNLTFQIADARQLHAGVDPFSLTARRPRTAAVNTPHSKRFANSGDATASRQRLECGDFSAALVRGGMERLATGLDVVFSNAALHWVDDHQAILRGAAAVLKPGGRLIVSCGGKGNAQDVFVALRPVMRLARWRKYFRKLPKPYFFYAPQDYEKWLPRCGFKSGRVELAPKDATYDGVDGFAAWLRTTWLPYTHRVPERLRDGFIAAVTERYVAKHPMDEFGKIHVHMVRLEIDAVKV